MQPRLILVSLILAASCITAVASSFGSNNAQDVEVKLPPGKWTLQHPVISRLGLADAPLKITSVKADVKNGGTITAVRLQNNSGKAVTAVKFAWYLFREQDPKKVVNKGESPILGTSDLLAGQNKIVEYPIVSFGNVYKPRVKGGKLTGDFVLEVAVSEIIYDDGSKWERE